MGVLKRFYPLGKGGEGEQQWGPKEGQVREEKESNEWGRQRGR